MSQSVPPLGASNKGRVEKQAIFELNAYRKNGGRYVQSY